MKTLTAGRLGFLIYGWLTALSLTAWGTDLERGFVRPPAAARPWVYWFPLSGNLTKEGITADLESMARVGIGGLIYMEVDQGAPKGPADFAGPQWRELFQHLCREAHRLGLEINMNNDAGWCGSGGPWITPELSMQKVVWTETMLGKPGEATPQPIQLDQPREVKGFYRDIAVLAMPLPEGERGGAAQPDPYRTGFINGKAAFTKKDFAAAPAEYPTIPANQLIARDQIIDLSNRMDRDGKLNWTPPPGQWLVIRFGHTTTGKDNHPAPESGRGLECDKFSKVAAEVMFNGLMGKLIAENQKLTGLGKVLVSTHIDSWEVGSQNWTPRMREEFRQRRGYDLWPFLPTFTGRAVDSVEVTERFLWDLRQTVSDLIVENYAGAFRALANRHHLRLSIEAYDGVPCDEMTYGGQADEPMAEFWSWTKFGTAYSCTEMTSAAHIYGKKICGAEAFTATDAEKWRGHPGNVKDLGDWAFCEGINRFVFHRYAAQPWTNRAPGMSMGPWGLHYERTQTWWEQSRAWHEYLARCQFLLQQGLFVADIAYLQPEGSPRRFAPPPAAKIDRNTRGGYNFDGCTPEVVLTRMQVRDGRLVLPDGMSYRVLALPQVETMTPRLLRRIKELAEAGATIVGDVEPPRKSPSLADIGAGDAAVQQMAAALWAGGKIITNQTAQQVLAARGIKPDFTATPTLRFIHRTIGDAEVYFVANPNPENVAATAAFRVTGKQPELWWPDSGHVRPASAFEIQDGVTSLPLSLEPSGSLFVVFRKPVTEGQQVARVLRDGQLIYPTPVAQEVAGKEAMNPPGLDLARGEIWQSGAYELQSTAGRRRQIQVSLPEPQIVPGPWQVQFDSKWGGPAQPVQFDSLEDWTQRPEEGIKYYSGAATYRTTFTRSQRADKNRQKIFLDLGQVAVIAEVKLNGRDLGILWKPPYRVEVSQALRSGENRLEVKVVNLWINRQVGDEQLPEDSERNAKGTLQQWPEWLLQGKPSPSGRYTFTNWRLWKKNSPLVTSGMLGPVTLVTAERWPSPSHR